MTIQFERAPIFAVLFALLVSACKRESQSSCLGNLKQIAGAKAAWGFDNSKTNSEMPTKQELLIYLPKWPRCPQGGTYSIEDVRTSPRCSVHDANGHRKE